jgi:thioredoxin-related protein
MYKFRQAQRTLSYIKFLKLLPALFLLSFSAGSTLWLTNLSEAKDVAGKTGRLILLNFNATEKAATLPDKEVFNSKEFKDYASENLVLLSGGLLQVKHNDFFKADVKYNQTLIQKYNPSKSFPLIVLLDAEGNELNRWKQQVPLPGELINEIEKHKPQALFARAAR